MPWYIYIALKQLFPSNRGFSFFAMVSIIGVSLGVAVLLGVQSIMNGFGNQIRESLVKFNGDIRIESTRVIYDWERLEQFLDGIEDIELFSPYAHGVVMLQRGNLPVFPTVMGIDMTREQLLIPVEEYLVAGSLDDFDDDSVILGAALANRIGATLGSEVEALTPLMLDRLKKDEVLLPRALTVVGLFESGRNDVDSNTMLTTLRLMQELYGLEEGIHGIALRLKEEAELDKTADYLNEQLSVPLRATTWLEAQSEYIFVLQFEKTMMTIVLFFIILVASFSIASALMISVIRKTKEIGLLAAMGARTWQIALSYCVQGLVIGISGSILGILLQATILHFRNEIVWNFARLTGSESALLRFYMFNDIPVHYQIQDFQIVCIFTILLCLLAGVIPALRAMKLKPAEALRSE